MIFDYRLVHAEGELLDMNADIDGNLGRPPSERREMQFLSHQS